MNVWKSIFGNSEKNKNHIEYPNIPENFRELTVKGIELIGRDSKKMENAELLEYLISKGIPDFEAGELIIFLPTAFTRKMLPELPWLPEYYDFYSEKKKIKRKYNENARFRIIAEETENYWNTAPNNEYVLDIAGRSAEFQAINAFLNDGGKLEDLQLTESYVMR